MIIYCSRTTFSDFNKNFSKKPAKRKTPYYQTRVFYSDFSEQGCGLEPQKELFKYDSAK